MSGAPSSDERTRPVQLQVNTRGSWANVVAFDAGNDLTFAHIADAANTLGRLHDGSISFRIVTAHQPPIPVLRWTKENGWKKVTHAD